MAQDSPTWISPYQGDGTLTLILNSLSQFLAAPIFPAGISLGDPGSPDVYDPATGALVTPAPIGVLTWDGTNLLVTVAGTIVKTL